MNTNRDLLRMQHVRRSSSDAWDEYKKGFDALAGAVLVGGLVQALLLALKGSDKGKGKVMEKAAIALIAWLKTEDAHCPLLPEPPDVTESDVKRYVAGLIELTSVRDAMIIQSEALHYLSQAKLVTRAFGD
jgi:hypothetical protein